MGDTAERICLPRLPAFKESTFCVDQADTDTVQYIRADLHQQALDRIEALEAENKRLREGMEWQPIETAPKNPAGERSGPKVLLWDKYYGRAVTACWTTEKDFRGPVITGWWEVGISGRGHLSLGSITHWAPLTTTPAEGEE